MITLTVVSLFYGLCLYAPIEVAIQVYECWRLTKEHEK